MAGVELQKFANVIQCDMTCKINNNNKKQQKTVSCFAASTVRTARLAEFKLLGHVILTAVLETHIKHFATQKIFGGLLRGRHVRDACIHLHILPRSWCKQILVNASFKFVLVHSAFGTDLTSLSDTANAPRLAQENRDQPRSSS